MSISCFLFFHSQTFTTFHWFKLKIVCLLPSTASSEWGGTITACVPAATLSPTSPPSSHGTSRSTRRQSAVPPTASNISPRGRSVGGWVRNNITFFSLCVQPLLSIVHQYKCEWINKVRLRRIQIDSGWLLQEDILCWQRERGRYGQTQCHAVWVV